MLSEETLANVSAALLKAEEERVPIDPLSKTMPEVDVPDAYRIQRLVMNSKFESGAKLAGRKIGLTSKAMQNQLGVHTPDFGCLTDRMIVFDGDEVQAGSMIQPRVEAEVAFLLGRELKGPGVTPMSVMQATHAVFPALEIIDSRFKDWAIKLVDTVADNASSAFVVLSEGLRDARGVDLKQLGMNLWVNGELQGSSTGAAVMGHPANAVAWLVNKLGEFGESLAGGDVVMSGAISASVKVARGDVVLASFGGDLGTVATRFV